MISEEPGGGRIFPARQLYQNPELLEVNLMAKEKFEKLFSPIKIGQLTLKNRLMRSAHETSFPTFENGMTEQYKAYYEARAKGGVALCTVESPILAYPLGGAHMDRLRIDDDKYIKGWSELVQVIHKYDCRTFVQLVHIGQWHPSEVSGLQPVSASALSNPDLPKAAKRLLPRELTIAEIEEIVDKFANAAVRAEKAGFDGVEVNAGAAHLLDSFLSRAFNKRQDAYGCMDLNSRSRIVVEIIKAIKKRLGQDFPVSTIINGMEFGDPDSTTIKESQKFARILQDSGADAIQARFWWSRNFIGLFPDLAFHSEPLSKLPRELDWSRKGVAAFAPLAAAFKEVVSIPVITVGRYDAVSAEKILQEGKADIIALARRTVADPEYANKAASGRLKDIRPCTGCLYCSDHILKLGYLQCQVNASVGKEAEYDIKEAPKRKKVMVVGGGPAGMEVARVAALRRHEVVLYEQSYKLGGSASLASMIKGDSEDLDSLISYHKNQLAELGVKVQLGEEVTPSVVRKVKPDVLILAAGGVYTIPEIPGKDKPNLVSIGDLNRKLKFFLRYFGPGRLNRLTKIWMPLGKKVVIMGGQIHGVQLAGFLADRGRQVTIVDTGPEYRLGKGMQNDKKRYLLRHLAQKGVRIITEAKFEEITDKGLVIVNKEGNRQTLEADMILPALPLKPNTELLEKLKGEAAEIYSIGSGSEPGLIADAIADGLRTACLI
jgi:2,4-dienoyl-CoA reductase (NADPH2)